MTDTNTELDTAAWLRRRADFFELMDTPEARIFARQYRDHAEAVERLREQNRTLAELNAYVGKNG